MGPLLAALLLAVSVKEDNTALRASCSGDGSPVASLAAGTPISIKYSLTGEAGPCYKVAAELGGKQVEGYLPAESITDLEQFDEARKKGAWLNSGSNLDAAIPVRQPSPPVIMAAARSLGGVAQQADELIESSRPLKALELLEPELRTHRDPLLLALAGVAAWRGDDSKKAIDYWHASLELRPDRDIEAILRKVEREAKSDQSNGRLIGLRVLLRYEDSALPVETARQLTAVLDEEFSRVSSQLGCNPDERVVAIIQSPEAYRKTTDAAEWSGGQYDGRIRIPMVGTKGIDAEMRRGLAHESVHACLTMLGRWPAWLHEGLAQKLSGDSLTATQRKRISEMITQGRVPRLSNLQQSWSRLDTSHAQAAYAVSLAAIELFLQDNGEYGLRNLFHSPERLPQITAELDRKLGL